jgi:hypothetical protein
MSGCFTEENFDAETWTLQNAGAAKIGKTGILLNIVV